MTPYAREEQKLKIAWTATNDTYRRVPPPGKYCPGKIWWWRLDGKEAQSRSEASKGRKTELNWTNGDLAGRGGGSREGKKGEKFLILHFQVVKFCSRFACERSRRSRSRQTERNASNSHIEASDVQMWDSAGALDVQAIPWTCIDTPRTVLNKESPCSLFTLFTRMIAILSGTKTRGSKQITVSARLLSPVLQ